MEEWRLVGNSQYSVSSLGRIRNDKTGRVLRLNLCSSDYLQVSLQVEGKRTCPLVHVLVGEAFIGPRGPRISFNHIDGNKCNNERSNLERITFSENVKHAYRMGLKQCLAGSQNPWAKHTEERVFRIRRLWATGLFTQKKLGKMFGVGQTNISDIVNRKRWQHA